MKEEDALFLNQLVKSLEEAGRNAEDAYAKRSYEKFNQSKKAMIQIQREIAKIIE